MHPSLADRSYIRTVHDTIMDTEAVGVSSLDSHVAALVGSAILRIDRAATTGDTLVEYMTDPHPHEALACCNASNDGKVAVYHIYVPALWMKLQYLERQYVSAGGRLPPSTMVAALAAHEVRHRLQKQLGPRLRRFSFSRKKRRADAILNIVATVNRITLLQERRRLREVGTDSLYVKTATGPLEFDACIIEHLVVRRLGGHASADEIAALVNLNDEP